MADHPRVSRSIPALSIAGFVVFVVLTAVVQARLLVSTDLAIASATSRLASGPLDAFSGALSIIFSAEMSLLFALLTAIVLYRRGIGVWSLAPLAFLILIPLEIAMKLVVLQPTMPVDLHRSVYYPLASIDTPGSFPSGHAIRSGFLCIFYGVLLHRRGGTGAGFAILGLVLLAVAVGFTRIYLGDHWLSDVVAGLTLGASLGQIAATPISGLLTKR